MRTGAGGSRSRVLPRTSSGVDLPSLDEVVAAYQVALERQPLAESTRRAYKTKVVQFAAWLAVADLAGGDPLVDAHARDYAARDFKAYLKVRRQSPNTINQALAALDSFYRFVGLGSPVVSREELPAVAPRALDAEEQKRLLRAVEERAQPRDRAIIAIGLFAGLRLAELVALDIDDVPMSARKGRVIVRQGKGGLQREVAMHAEVRAALDGWLSVRRSWPGADSSALFISRRGGRLTVRAVDQLVGQLGATAHLTDFSTHVLRHTFCTRLVRAGHDLVLVAELAGHRRIETTRRYSLPTAADRQAAVDSITADR
ncbi:MAG: tyrosine-type recombinase/integrase [Actinomycetota bacterium]